MNVDRKTANDLTDERRPPVYPASRFTISELMLLTAVVAGVCTLISVRFYFLGAVLMFALIFSSIFTWFFTEQMNDFHFAMTRRRQLRVFLLCLLIFLFYLCIVYMVAYMLGIAPPDIVSAP